MDQFNQANNPELDYLLKVESENPLAFAVGKRVADQANSQLVSQTLVNAATKGVTPQEYVMNQVDKFAGPPVDQAPFEPDDQFFAELGAQLPQKAQSGLFQMGTKPTVSGEETELRDMTLQNAPMVASEGLGPMQPGGVTNPAQVRTALQDALQRVNEFTANPPKLPNFEMPAFTDTQKGAIALMMLFGGQNAQSALTGFGQGVANRQNQENEINAQNFQNEQVNYRNRLQGLMQETDALQNQQALQFRAEDQQANRELRAEMTDQTNQTRAIMTDQNNQFRAMIAEQERLLKEKMAKEQRDQKAPEVAARVKALTNSAKVSEAKAKQIVVQTSWMPKEFQSRMDEREARTNARQAQLSISVQRLQNSLKKGSAPAVRQARDETLKQSKALIDILQQKQSVYDKIMNQEPEDSDAFRAAKASFEKASREIIDLTEAQAQLLKMQLGSPEPTPKPIGGVVDTLSNLSGLIKPMNPMGQNIQPAAKPTAKPAAKKPVGKTGKQKTSEGYPYDVKGSK